MSPFALPIAELKPALAGLGKIIGKRATLPVLGHVKIERTKDGWIALTGTDLDHHVTVRLEQPAEGEADALLVPFEELQKALKAAGKSDEILVERSGTNIASIKYLIGQQFVENKVESLPVGEFPETPRIKTDAIALPEAFRSSIHEALDCASTDETRLILNGAYLDVTDHQCRHVVGTDGRHLYSSNSFHVPLAKSLLIPSHRFLGWKDFNADGEWQLKVGVPEKEEEAAPFQISSRRWRFIRRQIEGNYPDWRQAIPGSGSFATCMEFDPEVEGVIQTIQSMPCDDAVNFIIGLEATEGKVSLLGRSPGAEQWTRITLEGVKSRGKDVRIFLNRNFLIKALQFGLTAAETIDEMSPLRFNHGGRLMIVIPTRPKPAPVPAPSPAPMPPAAQNEPTTPPEPKAPESPERKSMPENTNGQKPTAPMATNVAEKSALETALTQIEVVRGDFRNALAGLHKLAESLKQVQRESKASDNDIQSVRQTLRSLQSVRL